jgi:GDP-L-fucose synthase
MLGRTFTAAWGALRPDDELHVVTRAEVDLRDQPATSQLIARISPDAIVHAAARVGGIAAKLAAPTPYLLDNLRIDANVIGAALEHGVPELLCLGSAVVYPARYERPFVETDMLTGRLEAANEGYAVAKIAAATLCAAAARQHGVDYRVAVPSNLFGPYDRFSPSEAHLVAAALAKVHAASVAGESSVMVWGDGTARREFTYAHDLAVWLVSEVGRLARWPPMLNLGCGVDHTVREYYEVASRVVGFRGNLHFDVSKPAGVARRLLDSSAALAMGWQAPTSLLDGMSRTYETYLADLSRR